MVRHPHFTQPIFVRFPRPPVLQGSAGVAAFPPAADVSFEEAIVRQLVALDRRVSQAAVLQVIDGRQEEDVRRALLATRRTRPDDVLGYFRAAVGPRVSQSRVGDTATGVVPLQSVEDPYAP
jgi:hypothetical protein